MFGRDWQLAMGVYHVQKLQSVSLFEMFLYVCSSLALLLLSVNLLHMIGKSKKPPNSFWEFGLLASMFNVKYSLLITPPSSSSPNSSVPHLFYQITIQMIWSNSSLWNKIFVGSNFEFFFGRVYCSSIKAVFIIFQSKKFL